MVVKRTLKHSLQYHGLRLL